MSDDQDECEWVSVSSGTGSLGSPGQRAVKRVCVCVFVWMLITFVCVVLLCRRAVCCISAMYSDTKERLGQGMIYA